MNQYPCQMFWHHLKKCRFLFEGKFRNCKIGTNHGCHGLAKLCECKQGVAKGSPFSLTASPSLTCFLIESGGLLRDVVLVSVVFCWVFFPDRNKGCYLTLRLNI